MYHWLNFAATALLSFPDCRLTCASPMCLGVISFTSAADVAKSYPGRRITSRYRNERTSGWVDYRRSSGSKLLSRLQFRATARCAVNQATAYTLSQRSSYGTERTCNKNVSYRLKPLRRSCAMFCVSSAFHVAVQSALVHVERPIDPNANL